MAAPRNRSPSPNLARPNPNLRASETNSNMRRSFSGNPFARPSSLLTNPRSFNPTTPANSPADSGRRKSMGKEGINSSRGYEEKENEKDFNTKASRVRSPAKGSKNFMSPTISTASKFTPSPRKKVLAEKNDLVRSSISFSDDKISFTKDTESELKSQMFFDQNKIAGVDQKDVLENARPQVPSNAIVKEDACFDVSSNSALKEDACFEVPSNSENASESLSDLTTSSDCVKVESNHNNNNHSCSSASPVIAPLDADPSLPPYDPRTNYLSPRPLFLRYKPNPRVEVFLNKQVLDFEESLMSEIFSDTDVTEETQSEESLKESDDSSSVEMVPEEELPFVFEPSKHSFEARIAYKPKFFTRSRSISLLLVFLIACLCISVTDSPVIGSPMFEPNAYDPSEVIEFAKANFDGVVRNLKQWSANSISYLSKIIPSFSKTEELSLLRYSNMSASQEELLVDGYFNDKLYGKNQVQNELENVKEEKAETEPLVVEKACPENSSDDHGEEALEQEHGEPEIEEVQPIIRAESSDYHISEDVLNTHQIDDESHIDTYLQSTERIEDESGLAFQAHETKPELEAAEIELEVVKTEDFQGENDLSTSSEFKSNIEVLNSEISTEIVVSEILDTSVHGSEEKFSALNILGVGVSILVFGLVLGSTFIYVKQSKANSNPNVVEPLLAKKMVSSNEYIYQEKTTSGNWQTEVDESSSCPSEMSSFQNNSSYNKREVTETSEAHSHERRPKKNFKRESLASSSSDYSMGESYGSFTTYERIPKHGSGDEEIVTPVRRSSRIRSLVTSP
ncbi:hypothetical protein LguiA_027298 [Lonicera macranthoides]